MTKQHKEPKKARAKILRTRLRRMVQLQQFEKDDRFIIVFQVSPKYKMFVEFDQMQEVMDDFDAIVKVKKIKNKKNGK